MISVFYLYTTIIHKVTEVRGLAVVYSAGAKLSEYPVSTSALILLWNFVLYVICRFTLYKYNIQCTQHQG